MSERDERRQLAEEDRREFVRFTISKTLADGGDPGPNERVMASLITATLAKVGYIITPAFDLDRIAELEADLEDSQMVIREVALVYDHITGGRISKCNTVASAVIGEADELTEQAIREAVAELEAENSRLTKALTSEVDEHQLTAEVYQDERSYVAELEAEIAVLRLDRDNLIKSDANPMGVTRQDYAS